MGGKIHFRRNGGTPKPKQLTIIDNNGKKVSVPRRAIDLVLSFTKDEVDCSVIAKKNGGGGHKKAAGFISTNLKEVFNFLP